MVRTDIYKGLSEILSAYIVELRKHYKVDYIVLFGSFANGTQHEDSDIDVAVISNDVNDSFYDRIQMMELRRKLDIRIEPHPINTTEYVTDANPFIKDIKNSGIQLFAA